MQYLVVEISEVERMWRDDVRTITMTLEPAVLNLQTSVHEIDGFKETSITSLQRIIANAEQALLHANNTKTTVGELIEKLYQF